jgi:Flp pilus assembly protein TadG
MAVEFALVVPPLMLLCFSFIAVTMALQARSTMQTSAQMAARMMSTGQVTNFATGPIAGATATATTVCSPSLASTTVEYHACAGLPTWASYSVTATQTCAVPSVTVRIQASGFSAAVIGDRYGILAGKVLTVSSAMMKEGTCT